MCKQVLKMYIHGGPSSHLCPGGPPCPTQCRRGFCYTLAGHSLSQARAPEPLMPLWGTWQRLRIKCLETTQPLKPSAAPHRPIRRTSISPFASQDVPSQIPPRCLATLIISGRASAYCHFDPYNPIISDAKPSPQGHSTKT